MNLVSNIILYLGSQDPADVAYWFVSVSRYI